MVGAITTLVVAVLRFVALAVVGPHLYEVARTKFLDGFVARCRQERCLGDKAEDGEVGTWLVRHGLLSWRNSYTTDFLYKSNMSMLCFSNSSSKALSPFARNSSNSAWEMGKASSHATFFVSSC